MQIQANGLHIEVGDQGPTDGPVVLLIMGCGMQRIAGPQAWACGARLSCAALG